MHIKGTFRPQQCAIQPKHTVLVILMHKECSISVLNTRQGLKNLTPKKHEPSYRVQYCNLSIFGPDPKYNTDRTFTDETEEQLCTHYLYLKSVVSIHPRQVAQGQKTQRESRHLHAPAPPPSFICHML